MISLFKQMVHSNNVWKHTVKEKYCGTNVFTNVSHLELQHHFDALFMLYYN